MVAKPHNDGEGLSRSGVPLARAQRLAARADSQTEGGSAFVIPMVVAGLVVVGGIGYVATQPPAVEAPQVAAAEIETPAQTYSNAVSVSAPGPVVVAEVAEEVLPLPVMPEPTPVVAPVVTAEAPRLSPCVQQIETRVRSIHYTIGQDMDWSDTRNRIRAAAQAALDCDIARVKFDGDIELATSDFASLRVRWDREQTLLDLAIVESAPNGNAEVQFTPDGLPIEFLIY